MTDLDLADLHARSLAATGKVVAAIRPDQMGLPTPCTEWDLRQLLNHVVAGNLWAAELATGSTIAEVGDRLDGDVVGDDPAGAYEQSATAADAAFRRPGAMETPCAVSYGPVPGSVYAGHRFLDVLVHGWDLATAIGHESPLDPDLATACLAVIEPQVDQLLASGAFAPPTGDPPDQSAPTRLLHLLGRIH